MKAAYLAPAITLFNEDGTLDLASQERLYNNLIENGIDGILVEGSSSEFFAMNMDERREMAKFAIEKVNHRVKLIIGTSNMVASEISEFSNFCLDAGADAVMILPPNYFHFGPEALLQYYDRLAKEIHGPIYIYNFPDNTGYSIPVETVLQLVLMHPNIVGLKDTIPGVDHTRELIKVVKSRVPSFEIYSGFDDNFARNVLSGGDGCIAALSNLAPELTSAWVGLLRPARARSPCPMRRLRTTPAFWNFWQKKICGKFLSRGEREWTRMEKRLCYFVTQPLFIFT